MYTLRVLHLRDVFVGILLRLNFIHADCAFNILSIICIWNSEHNIKPEYKTIRKTSLQIVGHFIKTKL